jgi:hypothetical protein
MANTTNYNWETPDDTDLVKDGAAAIRTLGSSIDTTTKNLNPETTTGDIAYRSATANVNTRLPLGTAGQVLKVNSGATAPEWATDASGMTNPMTTTGDTIYSSSGSTPARLGIGSTGDVLTVAGGVPSWAAPASGGGMTLLSTTTLSGASTSISVTGGYNYIVGIVTGVTNNTNNGRLYIAPNGVTNLSSATGTARYAGAAATVRVEGYDNGYLDLTRGYDTLRTSADNAWYFTIYNYTSSTRFKPFSYAGTYIDNDSASDVVNFQGAFRSNTAVTTLDFSQSGGNFSAGTVLLYGVK